MIQMLVGIRSGTGMPQFVFLAPEHFVQLHVRSAHNHPIDLFAANAAHRPLERLTRMQVMDVCEVLGIPEELASNVQLSSWSQAKELHQLLVTTGFPDLSVDV